MFLHKYTSNAFGYKHNNIDVGHIYLVNIYTFISFKNKSITYIHTNTQNTIFNTASVYMV